MFLHRKCYVWSHVSEQNQTCKIKIPSSHGFYVFEIDNCPILPCWKNRTSFNKHFRYLKWRNHEESSPIQAYVRQNSPHKKSGRKVRQVHETLHFRYLTKPWWFLRPPAPGEYGSLLVLSNVDILRHLGKLSLSRWAPTVNSCFWFPSYVGSVISNHPI